MLLVKGRVIKRFSSLPMYETLKHLLSPLPSPLVKLTVPPLISNEGGEGGRKMRKTGGGRGECRIGQCCQIRHIFEAKIGILFCSTVFRGSFLNFVSLYEDFLIQSCSIIP